MDDWNEDEHGPTTEKCVAMLERAIGFFYGSPTGQYDDVALTALIYMKNKMLADFHNEMAARVERDLWNMNNDN